MNSLSKNSKEEEVLTKQGLNRHEVDCETRVYLKVAFCRKIQALVEQASKTLEKQWKRSLGTLSGKARNSRQSSTRCERAGGQDPGAFCPSFPERPRTRKYYLRTATVYLVRENPDAERLNFPRY